jgi:hypothetical protein
VESSQSSPDVHQQALVLLVHAEEVKGAARFVGGSSSRERGGEKREKKRGQRETEIKE